VVTTRQSRHEATLKDRRLEYDRMKVQHYDEFDFENDKDNLDIMNLCRKDAKRTFANTEMFKHPVIEDMLVRLLFVWNIR
jgi:hypothetical protein